MREFFINRCRTCTVLQECSNRMISLFEKNLSEMFTDCTSLEIDSNESLPSFICFECFGHLSNFNKFRQKCITSDAYFREQIITAPIKEEPPIDVNMELEENPAEAEDIESEFFKIEYIDAKFEQYHYVSTAQNDVTSPVDTHSNSMSSEKYICHYCDRVFNKKTSIGAHMARHRNGPEKNKFPCTIEGCSRVYKTRELYNRHRWNSHKLRAEPRPEITPDGEKIIKLICQQCPKWFTIQLKLDAHIRSYHQGLKGYRCEHCEKEFCKYRSYNRHLRVRHGTDETEKHYCTYDGCDREYGALDSLKNHIKRIHLGIVRATRKPTCGQCGQVFKTRYSLKKHSLKHSEISPSACKVVKTYTRVLPSCS
ncbi:zinc finger protein 28-like [Bradysia coprophila]|uniref:zinc finger protein 28-like n=1 Tax=Bradysia coprophila TaxID=38358 RepID=UPI00187DD817|nr:zinc finger protein 28-like [Bradysia coprophila]